MTIDTAIHTIAILSPGDMGHAVGRALGEHGHNVITCLAGRSERTKALAGQGGFNDVADLEILTKAADLILSIIPPAAGLATAESVAAAMERSGAKPHYADCNALSPATAGRIADVITGAGAGLQRRGRWRCRPCNTLLLLSAHSYIHHHSPFHILYAYKFTCKRPT